VRLLRIAPAALLGGFSVGVGLLGVGAVTAGALQPATYTCRGGVIAPGTYGSVTVAGTCYVPSGAVTIHGNLTLAPGSLLDAVSPASGGPGSSLPGDVYVSGNVTVGQGAALGLGCGPSICEDSTNDSVGGSLTAVNALAVIVHGVTIGGNATVTGGGGGVTCDSPPLFDTDPNLAGSPAYGDFENNTIRGNLSVLDLQSCWLGALRNQVGGNANFSNNTLADPDADELLNNDVTQNLVCLNDSPAVQFGDSGAPPNVVGGFAVGQCAAPISVKPKI
jgi:hypothetical protein